MIHFLFSYSSLKLLLELSKNDFKSRYSGNFGGFLWALAHPTFTIAIFWFVFSVGFKSAPVQNTPFILWLVAGIVPWFFFSEAVESATHSILQSHFLVKKIVFDVRLLPLVKIISALRIHLFFLCVLMALYFAYGYAPTVYWFQLIYYVWALIIFILGISFVTSSVIVFFRDLQHLVSMAMQFGFWLTPIFWTLTILPETYWWIFKLNPLYYITQGFRDSLIEKVWFWEKAVETIIFWGICLFFLWSGRTLFNKLKPHFADVI